MHLTEEMYLLLLRGVLEPSRLAEVAHVHALEECDHCQRSWERFLEGMAGEPEGAGLGTADPRPADDDPPSWSGFSLPLLPDDDSLSIADYPQWKQLASRMRLETRKAREDVGKLLDEPMERWEERIETSRTRFRSRAFAQHLLTRCRETVRSEPRVAGRLAALVPAVLRWLPGADTESWGRALHARAEAYRANAERVEGDLPAAARRFAALRARLERRPLADAATLAEIDSLEASLLIGQRRLVEAEAKLGRAIEGARRSGHHRLLTSALTQRGTVFWAQGKAERALSVLEIAASEMNPEEPTYEHACVLATKVLVLTDLERYSEASDLLEESAGLFRLLPHSEAYLAAIRGRVALGLERWDEAVRCFGTAQSALLALGRDYDAALASLDLAHAHLGAGDTARLHELAAGLVPLFRNRDVGRETLAVLRLVAEAVAQDRATVTLLAELRQRLRTSQH